MTARIREFNAFLKDHVNLNSTRVDRLRSRVTSLDNYLSDAPELADLLEDSLIPQGSFAHKTIIRPASGNDFDADVLLPMVEQPNWEPKKYTSELKKTLDASPRYAEKTVLGKRCVTIEYANDFHIDVVPFVERADGLTYITHRTRNEFLRQDPVAFTEWIEEGARATNGHLIRAVRLVKYLRDRSSIEVPSVVLAALLTEQVHSFAGVDDYGSVSSTLLSLLESLNDYIGPMNSRPWVDDRIGQNLADRLTESGFSNLQSQVNTWARKARLAYDADAPTSVEEWKKLFGDDFAGARKAESALIAKAASLDIRTYEKLEAPGEQRLDRDLGVPIRIDPSMRMRVIGRFAPRANGGGRFRPMAAHGNHVPLGRRLRFTIEQCTVEPPYDVYWKVRNAGLEAANRDLFRGEIRKEGDSIEESSDFAGDHWVQAWIVKDGVAIATDTQDVTILSR